MEIKCWARSDVGRRRTGNEDRYFADAEQGVFAVADGIGGKPGGAEASQMIVDAIEERAGEFRRVIQERSTPLNNADREEVFAFLSDALQSINQEVYRRSESSEYPRGIGSTVDLVVLAGGGAFILHVGDSRVYLVRGESIYRVTRDHTFEQYLNNHPRLGADGRNPAEYSHVLTRSIGGQPRVEVDRLFVDLRAGDRLLLCTDGITTYLPGSELRQYFDDGDDAAIPSQLIDCVNERGGKDNSTAVVVAVDSADGFSRAPTRPDTFRRVRFLQTVDLFSELGFQELIKVLRFVDTDRFDAGDTIIRRGDPVDGMYFVMDGEVSVEIGDRLVTTLCQGEHFGEFALFGEPVRSADVRCRRDCEVLFMSDDDLRRLVEESPALSNKLLWKMLARTSSIIQEMIEE